MFANFPLLEVITRYIYWNISPLRRFIKKSKSKSTSKKNFSCVGIDALSILLKEMGITIGDVVIVHSSYEELQKLDIKASEVFSAISEIIGPSGTLVMPAYPYFDEPDISFWRRKASVIKEYDVNKTVAWTGVLPNLLLRNPQSIRSEHPINTLVAIGHHASQMMKRDLTIGSYACGEGSPWEFCWRHNAKILALGIPMRRCNTMIHLNEDMNPNEWPIKNWYETNSFLVKNRISTRLLEIPVRRSKWSLHYCGSRLERDMERAGILDRRSINSVPVELTASRDLISFLKSKNISIPGYPFFYCNIFSNAY